MHIFLCEEYNCIFVVYSRCWSKTMIQFIKKLYNLDKNLNHSTITLVKNICLNKCSYEELENIKDKYYIYFMVRNPYERFISDIIAHNLYNNKSFIEIINLFKEKNYDYPSFYNDSTKILLEGKNVKILKFNNFQNELNDILIKHKFPIKIEGIKEFIWVEKNNTEFHNKNIYEIKLNLFNYKNMPEYQYFYNQEIIDYVYNKNKNDFIYFCFEKNINNLIPNDL